MTQSLDEREKQEVIFGPTSGHKGEKEKDGGPGGRASRELWSTHCFDVSYRDIRQHGHKAQALTKRGGMLVIHRIVLDPGLRSPAIALWR